MTRAYVRRERPIIPPAPASATRAIDWAARDAAVAAEDHERFVRAEALLRRLREQASALPEASHGRRFATDSAAFLADELAWYRSIVGAR